MALYGDFKYGGPTKYGGTLPAIRTWRTDLTDPDRGVVARYIKLTLKLNSTDKWQIGNVRLVYARRAHMLPKWLIRVNRNIKRTKVTLKLNAAEEWRVDSVRLRQTLKPKRPVA